MIPIFEKTISETDIEPGMKEGRIFNRSNYINFIHYTLAKYNFILI